MKKYGNTRERIIETARDLIWKHGYSHVTIDAICVETEIQKGSFYHFFENKAALAMEAFGALWERYRLMLDQMFDPAIPPLQRLRNYFDFAIDSQTQLFQKHGRVMGCPFCLLASELSLRDEPLGGFARDVLNSCKKYFERALRDAQAGGLIHARNIPAILHRLCAFIEGSLQQARIRNDLSLLRQLAPGAWDIIGANSRKQQQSRRRPKAFQAAEAQVLAIA